MTHFFHEFFPERKTVCVRMKSPPCLVSFMRVGASMAANSPSPEILPAVPFAEKALRYYYEK